LDATGSVALKNRLMEGRMPRSVKFVLGLGFLACLSAGCSTPYSIQPGIWSLKIEPSETNSPGEKYVRPSPRNVEVIVSWSKEEKGIELVRVQYMSRDGSQPVQRTLLGDIRNGQVTLDGYDQTWRIHLRGKIESRESMGGYAIGRVRHNEDIIFGGIWSLTLSGEE
jgi:hypothetical protein